MKRNLIFLALFIIVPTVACIPLGMLISAIFDKPLGEAMLQQHYYVAGAIYGAWAFGKGA